MIKKVEFQKLKKHKLMKNREIYYIFSYKISLFAFGGVITKIIVDVTFSRISRSSKDDGKQ